MKKALIYIILSLIAQSKLYSQTEQVTFPMVGFDLNALPRTQLSPMSIKLFDDYHSYRPSPATAPGNNSYGTILVINGRGSHWEQNLYFGADKKIYYRMCGYTGWIAEDGTVGGYNNWRTLLDSKSDIESSGLLKLTGNGNHYLSQGNFGIGLTNPTKQLQIGNTSNYSAMYNDYLNTVNHMIFESKDSNDGGAFIFRSTKNSGTIDLVTINRFGNVGIGTTTTGTHKLAVNGTIGAREIKVEATGWSDFVFEDDYQLKNLEEVESYITKNNHLPDVPSEKEVLENGIKLGEMDAKLLQKIEELTLYVIEQNKMMKAQSKEIQALNNKINKLEAQ
ncbi:hypothetical protein [Labilibaculum euxinus]